MCPGGGLRRRDMQDGEGKGAAAPNDCHSCSGEREERIAHYLFPFFLVRSAATGCRAIGAAQATGPCTEGAWLGWLRTASVPLKAVRVIIEAATANSDLRIIFSLPLASPDRLTGHSRFTGERRRHPEERLERFWNGARQI